ncbi:MAG: DUF1007 family protein [Pseudomonadota bacterium]
MTKKPLAAAISVAMCATAAPAAAHPHVFVDAGIDFVFGDGRVLQALEVTWRLDPFVSLYMITALGLVPDAEGRLDDQARGLLARDFDAWPEGFEGFARLSIDGKATALDAPAGLAVDLVDGRLQVSFTRRLEAPVALQGRSAEVMAYEATYYYAVTMPDLPALAGPAEGCTARAQPFEPGAELASLQTTLFQLAREETPDIPNVGALFADRAIVSCD